MSRIPGGSRLGNFGLLVISASYRLNMYATPEEVAASMATKFSWATPAEIQSAIGVAQQGLQAANLINVAVGAGGATQEDVGALAGMLPRFGTADVLVTNPNDPSQQFSVRFDFGGPQTPETIMDFALNLAKEAAGEDQYDGQDWAGLSLDDLEVIGIYPTTGFSQ